MLNYCLGFASCILFSAILTLIVVMRATPMEDSDDDE